jgi:hypothetical protein
MNGPTGRYAWPEPGSDDFSREQINNSCPATLRDNQCARGAGRLCGTRHKPRSGARRSAVAPAHAPVRDTAAAVSPDAVIATVLEPELVVGPARARDDHGAATTPISHARQEGTRQPTKRFPFHYM